MYLLAVQAAYVDSSFKCKNSQCYDGIDDFAVLVVVWTY